MMQAISVDAISPSAAVPKPKGQRGAIEFVAVNKYYGETLAIYGLDLKIPPASYCCLLGPSGCGKSTTLRMLAGHELATEGDILLDDINVTDLAPAQRGTAMMFQSYALFPHLSVLDNVAFALKMKGMARAERHAKAISMLKIVEMESYAERLPAQLSGGQQQRVALARALITNPSALLLDEPLSALDPFLRIRVRNELKRLQKSLGISFIHVTHSQDEALALADMIVLMNQGRIEQKGTAAEVFSKPRTVFAARFMGGHNVVDLGDRTIAVRVDQSLINPVATSNSTCSRIASVSGVEFAGTYFLVSLSDDRGADYTAQMDETAFRAAPLEPGQRVTLSWQQEQMHVLER